VIRGERTSEEGRRRRGHGRESCKAKTSVNSLVEEQIGEEAPDQAVEHTIEEAAATGAYRGGEVGRARRVDRQVGRGWAEVRRAAPLVEGGEASQDQDWRE